MKTLAELAALVEGAEIKGDAAAKIADIVHDSREVTEGTLFVAIEGLHVDGHSFIAQAVEKGACAILTEREIEIPEGAAAVLRVPNLAAALEVIVPFFHDYPSRKMRIIGITGTNGKTTTSYMTRAILREAGYKVGLIGTIQILVEDEALPIHNTTPDVVVLERTLAYMARRGMDFVVMEVSSHALDQNRVAGIEFDTAVFTNLTQDHLDYHKTLENYKRAKARLFDLVSRKGAKAGKTAVVNDDDAAGETMLAHAKCAHLTYAVKKEAALRAENIRVHARGMELTLAGTFGRMDLSLGVTGIFNVYNVMSAVGAALAERIAPEAIKRALEAFKSVPGRFELVDAGQAFSIIVDYAHTPDGLENILNTAREIAAGRILTVFGCGGDRDRTKRPIMGRIAAALSDVVLVTSDNPRTEDPARILDEVEVGVLEKIGDKRHEKIADRRTAIVRAVALAEKDDIVIIAGKGHENYQILKDKTIHFDDKEVAREAVAAREKSYVMRFSLADVERAAKVEAVRTAADIAFSDIVTDTRKIAAGSLFVALQGERFDGADFAAQAVEKGAAGVLVAADTPEAKLPKTGVVLKAKDTLLAYQQIAAAWRRKFSIPVVAITGSNGKTTTKDLTAAVLGARLLVQKTAANYNNEIGLPLTLLGLRAAHEAAVVEIGMRGLGQIAALAPLAAPTVAIVTNVGEVHMELLGSIENIAKAKAELVEAVESGGTVILNADDARVLAMREKAKAGVRVVTFGLSRDADVRAVAVGKAEGGMRFMLEWKNERGRLERHELFLPMPGRHNVSNALAAITAARVLGLSLVDVRRGLAVPPAQKMRFAVEKCGAYTFVNDAYNASPTSTRASLKTLAEMFAGRKIAVLGDMLELGSASKSGHASVGEEAAHLGFAAVLSRGEESRFIAEAAKAGGVPLVERMTSHEEAAARLKEILQPGDAVLFKGSRGMKMDEIIPLLKKALEAGK